MSNSEADQQIKQMIAFIMQEAKEKADEITTKAEKEFTADKLRLLAQSSVAIKEEYANKKKEAVIKKKIERSKLVNDARFAIMKLRDTKMKQLKQTCLEKLGAVSKHAKYPELIRLLIVQGLLTMQEDQVFVHCRECDKDVVKGQMDKAKSMYLETIKSSVGIDVRLDLQLSPDFLAPPPTAKGGKSCTGGVMLSARKGKIVCRNTLDARLELSFRELQPHIRGMLFGLRPLPESAQQRIVQQNIDAKEDEECLNDSDDDDTDSDAEEEETREKVRHSQKAAPAGAKATPTKVLF